MKILSGDCNAKSGNEDIFKPTFGTESLHRDSNDNGFRTVNCTYLHHTAEFCWRSSSGLSYSRNSPHFMETEGSLPA